MTATWLLLVALHGQPWAVVARFSSQAECEHHRVLVFEPTKTSTTRYRCKESKE